MRWTAIGIGLLMIGTSDLSASDPMRIQNKDGSEQILQTTEIFKLDFETSTTHALNIHLSDGKKSVFLTDIDRIVFSGGTAVLTPSIQSPLPNAADILRNYPNPFNPSTTVDYTLISPGRMELTVYNLAGQQIRSIESGWKSPGQYQAVWDGTSDRGHQKPSGMYILRLKNGKSIFTRKILLTK